MEIPIEALPPGLRRKLTEHRDNQKAFDHMMDQFWKPVLQDWLQRYPSNQVIKMIKDVSEVSDAQVEILARENFSESAVEVVKAAYENTVLQIEANREIERRKCKDQNAN